MEQVKQSVDQFMKNAIFSAVMLGNLINDLLDLGKVQHNAFVLNNSEFNMFETIENVFSIVSYQAEQKAIQLKLNFNVERALLLQRVHGDQGRLTQTLLNLISNSLKFT